MGDAKQVEAVAKAIIEETRKFDQDGYTRHPKPADMRWANRTEQQRVALCRVAMAAIKAMQPRSKKP